MSTLTKVFIVLQLVFSIGLAVVVVMAVGADHDAKTKLDAETIARVGAQAAIAKAEQATAMAEQKFNQAVADANDAKNKLAAEIDSQRTEHITMQTTIDTLQGQVAEASANVTRTATALASSQQRLNAKDQQVETIRPQLAKLEEQNAQLVVANQQLDNQMQLATKTIRSLQETIADSKREANTPKSSTAPTGDAVAQLSAAPAVPVSINGKVTNVQIVNGQTYLTISLGTLDGVHEGNQLTVSRDGNPPSFIADVLVKKAGPKESVATVGLSAAGQTVQPDDLVGSGL